MSTETSSASLEAYKAGLQSGWDDIENIPDYVTLPEGSFKGIIQSADFSELEAKDGKDAVGISRFTVLVSDNLDNPEAVEGIVGGLAQFSFMGEQGKARIKKSLWPVIEGLAVPNIDALWEQLPNKEIVFTVKTTKSKPDADGVTKTYCNLVAAMLAE